MSETSKSKVVQFPPPQLDEQAVRRIGGKLREHYETLSSEPVPDRFAKLLDQLEQSKNRDGDA